MEIFIVNIIGCVIVRVLATILMPEGSMKNFSLSMISLMLFYCLVNPIMVLLNSG